MPYESWPRARLARPPVKVTTLPASADELLLEAQRIRQHGADAELVARVRTRAAKHRGDRLAELTLAHAEISGGDRAVGEASLRRWLATHPDDVEALAMLAETLIEGAEDETDAAKQKAMLDEARRHLGRASRLEPDRYQTLYVYARSRMGEPGEPTLNTLEALDRAQELAPQVTSIRLNYASALLHDGRTGPAEIILAPLLNDPHDARAAAVARAMLAQAKGEAAPAVAREP